MPRAQQVQRFVRGDVYARLNDVGRSERRHQARYFHHFWNVDRGVVDFFGVLKVHVAGVGQADVKVHRREQPGRLDERECDRKRHKLDVERVDDGDSLGDAIDVILRRRRTCRR